MNKVSLRKHHIRNDGCPFCTYLLQITPSDQSLSFITLVNSWFFSCFARKNPWINYYFTSRFQFLRFASQMPKVSVFSESRVRAFCSQLELGISGFKFRTLRFWMSASWSVGCRLWIQILGAPTPVLCKMPRERQNNIQRRSLFGPVPPWPALKKREGFWLVLLFFCPRKEMTWTCPTTKKENTGFATRVLEATVTAKQSFSQTQNPCLVLEAWKDSFQRFGSEEVANLTPWLVNSSSPLQNIFLNLIFYLDSIYWV